ncbi:MAG: hypothetical protein U0002_10545 [Thermoanaerobaculia bacterium]
MSQRLEITLEGRDEDGGHVPLATFIQQLQLLSQALAKIDRSLSPTRQLTTRFRVVDLGHSSPARVLLEAAPRKGAPVRGPAILLNLFLALSQIDSADPAGASLESDFLEDLKGMAQPIGDQLKSLSLALDGKQFRFSQDFKARVERLLQVVRFGVGFLRGRLEAINLHAAANYFRLYPVTGPERVTCRFSPELAGQAVSAVGHYVEVRGILHYRAEQPYPSELDAKEIHILDLGPEVSWADLHGAAPAITGGLSAEEWIRARREALEEELSVLLEPRAVA